MQRNKQYTEGYNFFLILIILWEMLAQLVGCMVVIKYPEKRCECKRDTLFHSGSSLYYGEYMPLNLESHQPTIPTYLPHYDTLTK